MAVNRVRIAATRQAVWDVLSDGWTYTNWVVGASHMRAVESAWPAEGSRLFHSAGVWPLLTRDETVVTGSEAQRKLSMTARGRPLGEAAVVLELTDDADGCLVTMHETPIAGPAKWLHSSLTEALLVRRNDESLARLAALCERRTVPS
jgi:Polyketide cyclase / dehydrase and lipid transport